MVVNTSILAKLSFEAWKQEGFKCYQIKKQIEPFCTHPSRSVKAIVGAHVLTVICLWCWQDGAMFQLHLFYIGSYSVNHLTYLFNLKHTTKRRVRSQKRNHRSRTTNYLPWNNLDQEYPPLCTSSGWTLLIYWYHWVKGQGDQGQFIG